MAQNGAGAGKVDPSLLEDQSHEPRAKTLEGLQKLQMSGAKPTGDAAASKGTTASISSSLRSEVRQAGPKIIKGNMYRDVEEADPEFLLHQAPTSDVGLKPVTVYHNLSPAELYEHALKYEPGTHIVSSGALATMSGKGGAFSKRPCRRRDGL